MNKAAFALVALAAASASADTKSWTALKTNMPSVAQVVIGIDVKAVRGSSAYAPVVQGLMDQSADVKNAAAIIKSTCSIDVTAAISDITFAIGKNSHSDGIAAIGLDGIDEKKLVDCATKIAKMGNSKGGVTSSKDGKATKYVLDDGKEKHELYATWPAKDVVVIALEPTNKASLDNYFNGKAAAGDLATYIGKAKTSGTILWVAAAINEEHMKGMTGQVTLAKGTFTGSGRLTADSTAEATKAVKDATQGISGIASMFQSKAPALAKAISAIKVAASGADVTIDGSVAEADVPSLFTAMLSL